MGAVGSLGAAPAAEFGHAPQPPPRGSQDRARAEPAGPAPLQQRILRRASEPGRVSAGRHRRGHDLPGRHRRALACLAAQPARGVQRAVRLRRHLASRANAPSRACWKARCRAGSSSARPAPATAPAARPTACRASPRPPSRPGSLSACVTLTDPQLPLSVETHRLEPVRARRRRQFQPAGRGVGIPVHQPQQEPGRGGVFVQRQELHGQRRQPAGGAAGRRRVHPLGRRRRKTSPGKKARSPRRCPSPAVR